MKEGVHLLFYDGECGLCDHAVQQVLRLDRQHLFVFAPLQGTTAKPFLKQLPLSLDSLVLVENFRGDTQRVYVMSQAVFRTAWLLGGGLALLGVFSFLPGWVFDWAYRVVARHRHLFFRNTECQIPDPSQKGRFLP